MVSKRHESCDTINKTIPKHEITFEKASNEAFSKIEC